MMVLAHTVWDLNGIDPVSFCASNLVMDVLVGTKIMNQPDAQRFVISMGSIPSHSVSMDVLCVSDMTLKAIETRDFRIWIPIGSSLPWPCALIGLVSAMPLG